MTRNHPKSLSIVIFAALSTLAIVACQAAAAPRDNPTDDLVLRAYSVPAPYGPEILSVIRGLFYRAKDVPPMGTVAISPSGELMVAAPKAFHPGIEQFLAGLAKAPPAPPASIRIDYWVVIGGPTVKPDDVSVPGQEIQSVLDAIRESQGPMQFTLLEKASATSLSGEGANNDGKRLHISQNAAAYGDRVIANIDIGLRGPNTFKTRVQIPLNKSVVLGQSNFAAKDWDRPASPSSTKPGAAPAANAESAVFYVIRAQVANP